MPGIILNDGTKARTPVTEHSSTLFQILHYENNLRKSAKSNINDCTYLSNETSLQIAAHWLVLLTDVWQNPFARK